MAILRLLRIPNLLILVATICIIVNFIIYPPLISNGIAPLLTNKEYYLLMFIALCLGAGGYVHNDIVDLQSDDMNQKRLIVGYDLSKKIAYIFYAFLSFGPLLLVLSLSMEVGKPEYFAWYLGLVAIFWLYNMYLKRLPLIGNIVVGLLCSFAVILPFLIDLNALYELRMTDVLGYKRVYHFIWTYGIFCFMANFIREIVKDIEDISGDRHASYKTLPVVAGISLTKRIIQALTAIFLLIILFWSWYYLAFQLLSILVVVLLLVIPLMVLLYQAFTIHEGHEFGKLSRNWKIFMLLGLVSLMILTRLL